MREIKFRLIKKGKIVGYEKHKVNTNPKVGIPVVTIFHGIDNENWWNIQNPIRFPKTEGMIEHDDKMQYTEIREKGGAGEEIYEGDRVLCDNKIGEVKYDKQQGAYIILWQPNNKKQKSGCDDLASTFPSPYKEVIDNPELLKEVSNE